MTTQAVPQGWYPDPQQPELLRWWDGTQWTNQTQPALGVQVNR
jgi:resuscitation-promoting factor RpfB